MDFLVNKKKQNRKTGLCPGIYTSEIVSVMEATGFVPGHAYTIVYELDQNGKSFPFSETFINDSEIPRTANFCKTIEGYGLEIDTWDQLVGLREEVEILKESMGKRGVYLNIANRKLVP